MEKDQKRPICKACQRQPRAVAYHKYERVYYRSMCDACIRKGKRIKAAVPRWQSSGYKKKKECDKCGFRARVSAQLSVYHIDGNLNNVELRNLKTICLNCGVEVNKLSLPWKVGDLEPDN